MGVAKCKNMLKNEITHIFQVHLKTSSIKVFFSILMHFYILIDFFPNTGYKFNLIKK